MTSCTDSHSKYMYGFCVTTLMTDQNRKNTQIVFTTVKNACWRSVKICQNYFKTLLLHCAQLKSCIPRYWSNVQTSKYKSLFFKNFSKVFRNSTLINLRVWKFSHCQIFITFENGITRRILSTWTRFGLQKEPWRTRITAQKVLGSIFGVVRMERPCDHFERKFFVNNSTSIKFLRS